jgi:DNA-binding transcriptional ArsR family regulator
VGADLATMGKALGSDARAAMIGVLFDGAEHASGDLARAVGVTSATASEHLRILAESGLVAVRTHGRHRLYRLRDERVAAALEQLARPDLPQPTSLRLSREQRRVRAARTCYDHLAGQLGVALTAAFAERGWLDGGLHEVTARGEAGFAESFDIDVAALRRGRRTLVRPCLDGTERRHHVAGALAAGIASTALARGWVTRQPGGRALAVTMVGHEAFASLGVAAGG